VNFLGMGPMEIVVILVVAFLVLGPGKTIDLARNAGKTLRDLRASFSDLANAVDLTEDAPPAARRPDPPPPEGREEADLGGRP
jgi:TatA/E family protein of Tat protein translocase